MQSDPTPAAQVLDDEDTTAGVWFDAPAAEPPPEHEPTLLALAGELMDELAEVRAERQANAAAEVVQVERVRRQYADLDYPLATRENRIEGELRRIYAVLPRRGKAKSRRIAGGILGTRTQGARLEVVDERALRESMEGWTDELRGMVLRPAPARIDHRALTAVVLEAGTVPDGCTLHPADEVFYARPAATGAAATGLDPQE